MGTPLGLKYIPYTYMDPLGRVLGYCLAEVLSEGDRGCSKGASYGGTRLD